MVKPDQKDLIDRNLKLLHWLILNVPINFHVYFKSLWPSDAIWLYGSVSTLAQIMVYCLMATNNYLNQCWLIICEVLWYSPVSNFTACAPDTILQNVSVNFIFIITAVSGPMSEFPFMAILAWNSRMTWTLQLITSIAKGGSFKGSFCVCVQPMRDGITL